MVQLSHLYMSTGKTIVLTMQTFVSRVMSLPFNTMSGLSQLSFQWASFNFTAAVTARSDFRAQEKKVCHCFHFSPSICHEVMGLDVMILVFWMLNFKTALSLSFFTLIKRLFSPSSLSAIRVLSSTFLRLLVFPPAILIPACDSSSPAFCMMYSA